MHASIGHAIEAFKGVTMRLVISSPFVVSDTTSGEAAQSSGSGAGVYHSGYSTLSNIGVLREDKAFFNVL